MSVKIQPAIMSGGAGARLWPMSRRARPKQFLALTGERSLFQETALRVAGADRFLAPLVIGGRDHAALIAAQLQEIGVAPAAIVTEPAPRNTAAVAAIAALWTAAAARDALVLLMPADHHIADADAFRRAVIAGADAARAGRIVAFGVKPTAPETGFGYIEAGGKIDAAASAIAAFREKPDLATAKTFVAGGKHFWNAGIFLFSPQAMLEELGAHAGAIRAAAAKSLERAKKEGARIDLDAEAFAKCPTDSIDYAVMEKTAKAAIVGPLDIGWSDIGSWGAIAPQTDARVFTLDSAGAIVKSDGPYVAVVGAPDMIVVATGDAVLVVPKSRAQDVRKIVEELKAKGRGELL